MSDDSSGKDKKIGRRGTLQLASAVAALGVGLGVVLDAKDATAETIKIPVSRLGKLSMKLFKFNAENQSSTLVRTFDLSALVTAAQRGGAFSFKFYNQKGEATELMLEHELDLTPEKP